MQIPRFASHQPGGVGNKSRTEPEEAPCHGARHSLCFLNCQAAPVDYSWLQPKEKLISAVRSRRASSDPARGRHEPARVEGSAGDVWLGASKRNNQASPAQRCLMSVKPNTVCGQEFFFSWLLIVIFESVWSNPASKRKGRKKAILEVVILTAWMAKSSSVISLVLIQHSSLFWIN